VIKIVNELIYHSSMSLEKERRSFRGAHINMVTMEVVLNPELVENDLLNKGVI